MSEKPLISFITICYNGYADTCHLIDSLRKNITSVDYEIVVVDNASIANEALRLKKKYPSIVAIRSHKNLGFAGGNNLGMARSKGDFFFFLNNDTYIEDDKIALLIDTFRRNPKIGGLSPQIKFAYQPRFVQYAGFTPLSTITLRNKIIGYNQPDNDAFDHPRQTPYLHGAAMMIKREVVDRAGRMPDIYFLYYEEIDWSVHITEKGYELWYDPQWTVYHKESQSTGQMSRLQVFYLTRNRLLYAWRNRRSASRWLSIIYQICIAATKNCLAYVINKRFDLIVVTFWGMYSFMKLQNKMR